MDAAMLALLVILVGIELNNTRVLYELKGRFDEHVGGHWHLKEDS